MVVGCTPKKLTIATGNFSILLQKDGERTPFLEFAAADLSMVAQICQDMKSVYLTLPDQEWDTSGHQDYWGLPPV